MHRREQSPTSLFRTIFLVAIAALIILAAAIPAFAQNSVPPTAVQAAKMPQYASRLAHPSRRLAPPKSQVFARATKHRGPLDSSDIYDNGPINGNTDAWTINFGFIVSDSFTITNDQTPITGMSFGAWLFSGDTVTSVEVSITSGENSGTSYFDQTVNFTQGSCTSNQYGYNVCSETTSFNGPTLNAGTYWVNLQNTSVPSGNPVYWDENSGPSQASENSIGSIPSEAFTILGNATTTTTSNPPAPVCPRTQTGFHDLRDFAPTAGLSGVVIDSAGKLYGTLERGGGYGEGLVYDFAQRAGHWFYSTLYNFLGGSNGGNPNGVIVGPQGVLYGSAGGGSYGYGLVYKATPPPTACTTALCSWDETTIYEFTSGEDAGSVTAFDSAGNLYGLSFLGGAYGQGAVFELSPSQGGWTETILHNFTGGSDGGLPTSLLLGHDGNLYGTASTGGNGTCDGFLTCGVVFQLVPSGVGWTEDTVYAFTGGEDGAEPSGLIQDTFGNLYGFSICLNNPDAPVCGNDPYGSYSFLFKLSTSGGFSTPYNSLEDCWGAPNNFHALAADGAGNLYAAEGGSAWCDDWGCYGGNCGRIVAVPSGAVLVSGGADIFSNLTSDANGNLYGTTSSCGFESPQRKDGMIWQYAP